MFNLMAEVVMTMLHDLEHPSIVQVNRTGYANVVQQPEYAGKDVFGHEVLSGDSVVFDGDEMILLDNLERYLAENYDFKFQTIE
jgi:archaeosine-15-forming tRNA-guanine transglycosylase